MSKEEAAKTWDIDDVLLQSSGPMLELYNTTYGTNVPYESFYSEAYDKVWGAKSPEELNRRLHGILTSDVFWEVAMTEEDIEGIRAMKRRFPNQFAVTGRPEFIELETIDQLNRYVPGLFNGVVFTNYYMRRMTGLKPKSKGEVCRELGADYHFDDLGHHVLSAYQAGVNGVLYGEKPWGEDVELPPETLRCKDMAAVRAYFNV